MAISSRSGSSSAGFVLAATVASILTLLVLFAGFAGSADAAGVVVNITDYGFAPSPVSITAGQTVTWVNKGAVAHWVEPGTGTYGGGFIASPKILPGDKYVAKFSSVGTFTYHDALYGFMSGTVLVKAAPPAAPMPTARPTPRPTAKPTARPTAKPTARTVAKATAKPTARPTAKPTVATAASATAAAVVEATGQASSPPAGAATTGSGAAGSGSTASGDSTGTDDGLGLGMWLAILGLVGIAFVGGIWFSTSRHTTPGGTLVRQSESASPGPHAAAPLIVASQIGPATATSAAAPTPPPPVSNIVTLPSDVDEDAPIQAARTRKPRNDIEL